MLTQFRAQFNAGKQDQKGQDPEKGFVRSDEESFFLRRMENRIDYGNNFRILPHTHNYLYIYIKLQKDYNV